MKSKIFNWYVFVLLIVAIVNFTFGSIMVFYDNYLIKAGVYVATLMEAPLLIWSLMLIMQIFRKKLHKSCLILPLFYSIVYIVLAIIGGVLTQQGVDVLDLSIKINRILYVFALIFYLAQMALGVHILRTHKK